MTVMQSEQEFLRFNPEDARKLLDRLDHIHLVAILPDAPKGSSPTGRYFGADVDAALDWAAAANGNGFNTYWTLNYVGPGVGTKPGKKDIQAARGAHCDLDPPKEGGSWDKGAAIATLTGHPAPPSLIIDSGNGLQPVWMMDAPAKDWLPVEAVNMSLRDTFGGDDCHNIDRLLRIPGSVNYPNKAKRERGYVACMASWVQEDTGQRYTPQDLVAAFPIKEKPRDHAAANDTGERVPTQTGALIAAIRAGDGWHNNMLRLTAHLVAKGRSTVEILAMADCLTLPGYTVEDTRADMRGMIADARAKWDYAEPADPVAEAGEPALLPALDLAALAKVRAKAVEFAIERIAPMGEVTLFTGPGSAGKSLLGQQFCTVSAAAIGAFGKVGSCLGLSVKAGPAIYVTCEDTAEHLHYRQERLCEALGVNMASLAGKLHLVSLRGELANELEGRDDKGNYSPSAAYHRLAATITTTGARLVALDNVAHLFAGNENDRHDVTRFVNLLNRLARDTGAAIVLIGHPNKSGDTYSGSTAWLNAVRSQVWIDTPRDSDGSVLDRDARVLTIGKANYAPKGEGITFRWHQWAFVRDEDLPADTRAEIAEVIKANGEDAAFMRCLASATESRRAVSHNPGVNYAPTVFAKMPEGKGYTRKAFEAAFERLLHLGEIELDAPLWQDAHRHWKQGIRAVKKCGDPLAGTPCGDLREPPAETRGKACGDPRAATPHISKDISGAGGHQAPPRDDAEEEACAVCEGAGCEWCR
jgi:RecA-family ATPase